MALLSVAVEHTSPDNQPEAIPYCCSDVLSVVWTDLAVVFPHNITQRLQPTGGAQDSFFTLCHQVTPILLPCLFFSSKEPGLRKSPVERKG